jgi:hypothetical protein
MDRRSELKLQYKMRKKSMGVFQIVNLANGKRLVDSSPDLDVIYNRHQFQLRLGMHRNFQLQEDWNRFGADSFRFEVLEKLDDRKELSAEVYKQLQTMKEKWLEKLQPFGERGYHG